MSTRIIFKGKRLLFIGFREEREGAICTDEQYRDGLMSYAHLFPDGRVLRHRVQIGAYEDIEWFGKVDLAPTAEAFAKVVVSGDMPGDGAITDA